MKEAREIIIGLVADQTGSPTSSITESTTLQEACLDSLDMVELVIEIEDRFNVAVPDAEADAWKTVGDMIAWVRNRGS